MEITTPYENFLSISEIGKGVPYGGGGPRPDGSVNHGFRPLKGDLQAVALIPEAEGDGALGMILRKINAVDSCLFSVGCLSADVEDPNGRRVTGYVEFAINDKQLVNDATRYFQIFFHFTQRLVEMKFSEQVRFNWELIGVTFRGQDCFGFTCRIIINTFFYPSREEAQACWQKSLDVLGDHLVETKDPGFQRIY
jgi:hypothetical protein